MADWITVTDPETGEFRGRFDYDKATKFVELAEWDGSNHISVNTLTQGEHQELVLTASGVWVLHHWSQWQGKLDQFEFITPTQAARWMIHNKRDNDHEAYFGEPEEIVPPNPGGRPYIGPETKVRLWDDLMEMVDQDGTANGWSRAETIRTRLAQWYGLVEEAGEGE